MMNNKVLIELVGGSRDGNIVKLPKGQPTLKLLFRQKDRNEHTIYQYFERWRLDPDKSDVMVYDGWEESDEIPNWTIPDEEQDDYGGGRVVDM